MFVSGETKKTKQKKNKREKIWAVTVKRPACVQTLRHGHIDLIRGGAFTYIAVGCLEKKKKNASRAKMWHCIIFCPKPLKRRNCWVLSLVMTLFLLLSLELTHMRLWRDTVFDCISQSPGKSRDCICTDEYYHLIVHPGSLVLTGSHVSRSPRDILLLGGIWRWKFASAFPVCLK